MVVHMSEFNDCVGNLFVLFAAKWIVVHYTVPLLIPPSPPTMVQQPLMGSLSRLYDHT